MKPLTVPAELLQDLELFAQIFREFHSFQAQRHTGPTIVNWNDGWPTTIEIPVKPRVIKLDRRKKLADH